MRPLDQLQPATGVFLGAVSWLLFFSNTTTSPLLHGVVVQLKPTLFSILSACCLVEHSVRILFIFSFRSSSLSIKPLSFAFVPSLFATLCHPALEATVPFRTIHGPSFTCRPSTTTLTHCLIAVFIDAYYTAFASNRFNIATASRATVSP